MTDTTRRLTIGELAERAGVTTSALRFYEDEGLITSSRTDAGHRRYAPDALRRVAFIGVAQHLGLSLAEIRTALDTLPDRRTPNRDDWERLSTGWRPLLDERITLLERLRDLLDGCIGCGCLSLDNCALYNPADRAAQAGPGPRHLLDGPPPD